ncbi:MULTISPECIES: response regulator [Olivibacter]|jgi:DNA-binding response OmpR family regulator|uniref:Response regulator receiver protein n=3 Tax=Sphingobacteriaceae TaxID=84566 RepID=F4CCK1_SPHS2|nr:MULTISPECIES: response regulator [Olivibacter]MCL4638838.1 response regulator [Olivibacter sp. UJ_SKK_5.1]MDX3915013.1 response regulator [Pseudosphingobacterium sp.]QEL03619.1 response regulator [Olivibacter sp. LS-1]
MIKKIMICDDDEGILDITGLLLESYGYQVLLESNSSRLLPRISSEKPDLLLIDIWMPLLMGDEIVRILKNNKETAHLPIIMFSAGRESERIASEVGADDYIAKPFNIEDLNNKIVALG